MIFHALLVLTDDSTAERLRQILAEFQVESEYCSESHVATQKLAERRYDAVIVDLEDQSAAASILEQVRQSQISKNAVTISLLDDKSLVRRAFGMGANFILYKPIAEEPARASLRAAIALLKRERRRSFRVPVQLPVTLSWHGAPEVEGIMLDLSENGMDVLSAQPLQQSQALHVHFSLPDLSQIGATGQVAWANSNGQAGVEFVDFPDGQKQIVQDWLSANAPEGPPPEPEPIANCKLSDLSLGGCYVESESPFPVNTEVELSLRASNTEIKITALIRVMHPGYGMGLEFVSNQGEHRQLVDQFISVLSSHPGSIPLLSISPKSIHFHEVASSASQPEGNADSLVELLRSDLPRSQDEFLAELRRQRNSAAEAAGV
ncbi:MAG TPA: PilZ domain-containing protein [Terriglobales bacterium]|jgi:DNA-binding NarL/FixJ family response regulator|nr:PilZ domain-containing protein [Terriglobales bacterium]